MGYESNLRKLIPSWPKFAQVHPNQQQQLKSNNSTQLRLRLNSTQLKLNSTQVRQSKQEGRHGRQAGYLRDTPGSLQGTPSHPRAPQGYPRAPQGYPRTPIAPGLPQATPGCLGLLGSLRRSQFSSNAPVTRFSAVTHSASLARIYLQ